LEKSKTYDFKHPNAILRLPVWLSRNSYSMPGYISAWMGDRLWTGKPPRCRTRHPGLLSLSLPSVGRLQWVPSESWGEQACTLACIHGIADAVQPIWLMGW